jgi:hypothetical protein
LNSTGIPTRTCVSAFARVDLALRHDAGERRLHARLVELLVDVGELRPRGGQLPLRRDQRIARALEVALGDRAGLLERRVARRLALRDVVVALRRRHRSARRQLLLAQHRGVELRQRLTGAHPLSRLGVRLDHRRAHLGADRRRALGGERAGEGRSGADLLRPHHRHVLRPDEHRLRLRRLGARVVLLAAAGAQGGEGQRDAGRGARRARENRNRRHGVVLPIVLAPGAPVAAD